MKDLVDEATFGAKAYNVEEDNIEEDSSKLDYHVVAHRNYSAHFGIILPLRSYSIVLSTSSRSCQARSRMHSKSMMQVYKQIVSA